jgi:hypothetical protein
MVPQSKGGQKFKKTIEHYKGQFLNTQKFPFILVFFAIKVINMICRTSVGAPIAL